MQKVKNTDIQQEFIEDLKLTIESFFNDLQLSDDQNEAAFLQSAEHIKENLQDLKQHYIDKEGEFIDFALLETSLTFYFR